MAAKSKPVASTPIEQISELTTKRDLLVEQRDVVRLAPRSFEESSADITKTVEMLAARCEPHAAWLAQGTSGYADLARHLYQTDGDYHLISAAEMLAWALPDVLAAALKRDLAAAYDLLPEPMTSAAKAAELQKLAREIAAVEGEMATTWWAATAAGLSLAIPPVDGATLIGLPST